MIQEPKNSHNKHYVIEFSENHDPERVLRFTKDCSPSLRAELIRTHPAIRGWAIFKVKNGVKEPTGSVCDSEEKAKTIVAHWLKIDRDRAAKAAHRAICRANELAELAGSEPIDTQLLMNYDEDDSENSESMWAGWVDANGKFIFQVNDDLTGTTIDTVHENDLPEFLARVKTNAY